MSRNLLERFFNRFKHCRRATTRYDKLAAYHPRIRPARVHTPMVRVNESTS
jgi:transposase